MQQLIDEPFQGCGNDLTLTNNCLDNCCTTEIYRTAQDRHLDHWACKVQTFKLFSKTFERKFQNVDHACDDHSSLLSQVSTIVCKYYI